MKINRILPKFLARTYQQEDLRRAEIHLAYHKGMVRVFEERVVEGREELERLEKKSWDAKSVLYLTKILVAFNYGKMLKCADYAVVSVTIFHGMGIICMNIGIREIEWITLSKMRWWRYRTSFW